MAETIIGMITGGIFRLIPEFLKWLDRKEDRKHEIAMQDKALEFQRVTGAQRMDEIVATGQQAWNTGALDVLQKSIEGQSRRSGVRWIDGFSSLMRPLITFQWVVLLYPATIVTSFFLLLDSGISVPDALFRVFGPDEKALVAGIMNFWFLGRVFDRVR